MKGNMLIFAPLCLLLCWMTPAGSKKISNIFSQLEANQDIPLSMVDDAVDDMYSHCEEKMMKMVKNKYFAKENTGKFADLWKKAQYCAKRNLKNINKGDEALTKDHMQAICLYTSNYKTFYEKFNAAVRTDRTIYGNSFPYHSLHFWLTSAVKILSNNKNCQTTYRRSNAVFTGKVNQTIRFGFFASTSSKADLTRFGTKTCFKIETCSGASLKKYPHLKDEEAEVLIPPYEMFIITKKQKKKEIVEVYDCDVLYFLKNAGDKSRLDCRAAN